MLCKNNIDGITVYMLGLRLVEGNVVLSFRPGGGDALTRGLNEVRRKINVGLILTTRHCCIVLPKALFP